MKTTRVLSIQDISCYGQCSETVALPILSSLGIETAILPTAILSTHTAGFKGFTFLDLKDEIKKILDHWKKEGVSFDAVYTGYLGNEQDVEQVLSIAHSSMNKGALIVDPAFGDNGSLYGGFDDNYVAAMRKLAAKADILLPNLTEAYALLGLPYQKKPSNEEVDQLLNGLLKLGAKSVLLKGIGGENGDTGFVYYDGKAKRSYSHEKLSKDSHGTGDVFASSFVGAYLQGLDAFTAGRLAANFVYDCIKNTMDDETHWYGVKFEPLLYSLMGKILKEKGE